MSERWDEKDDLDLQALEIEMRTELEEFREAATVYADRAWVRGGSVAAARPAVQRPWTVWAAATSVAAVLAVGGVRLLHQAAVPADMASSSTVQEPKAAAVSDEALLQQIQGDLSSGVPSAMEPLEASTDARAAQDAVKR